MRTALLALLLLAQAPTEPPEFPPGVMCVRPTAQQPNPDHPCDCHRECQPNIEIGEDGKPHDTITVLEDPKCKQWCHKDHCACPLKGCD